jgi:hypothetical protein
MHPLPRIDDTIDALSGAKYFSTADLKSGYYQIPVAEKDRHKTAFSFPGGGLWQGTHRLFNYFLFDHILNCFFCLFYFS